MFTQVNRATKHRSSPKRLWAIAFIAILFLAVLTLEITNTTHIFHQEKTPSVIPSSSNPSTTSTTNSKSTTSTQSPVSSVSNNPPVSSSKGTTNPSNNTSSTTTLITPYGGFVSNHTPGAPDKQGQPTPTSETSLCNTTPGASCYIKFTNTQSGVITQLSLQTVGADGSTSWNWDVKDAHLGSGDWQIEAVATLNGQTKVATDNTVLKVQ